MKCEDLPVLVVILVIKCEVVLGVKIWLISLNNVFVCVCVLKHYTWCVQQEYHIRPSGNEVELVAETQDKTIMVIFVKEDSPSDLVIQSDMHIRQLRHQHVLLKQR